MGPWNREFHGPSMYTFSMAGSEYKIHMDRGSPRFFAGGVASDLTFFDHFNLHLQEISCENLIYWRKRDFIFRVYSICMHEDIHLKRNREKDRKQKKRELEIIKLKEKGKEIN